MSKEIELKLRLPLSKVRRLLAHPVLSGQASQKYRLMNTYYDTPELDLRERGIALRLRRKGWAVWLMTVKGGDPGAGGLAQRSEWEAPTQPGVFDFSIVTDAGLRLFLEEHHSHLKPVFTTDFTRTAWIINTAGSIVEVALDRGKISALPLAESSTPSVPVSEALCELELELIEGASPDALFELAITLGADVQLHPEILSKAERGYALADFALFQPVKSFSSPVNKDMSPVEAFRAVALSCLAQLQRNEPGAIAGVNPEFVHQSRVAIRRLRSAFKLFSPVLAKAFVDVYSPRWKGLAASLGGARDWDVFLCETLAPLEDAFPGDSSLSLLRRCGETVKSKVQTSAGTALLKQEYSQLMLAFSAALFRVEPPTIAAGQKISGLGLRKFAVGRLKKTAEKIKCLVRNHEKMDAGARHELRLEFKKLRYALEFFAPVLPGKQLSKYQSSLLDIQDLLGALNDLMTALRLIKGLNPKDMPSPLIRGWIAGRTDLLSSKLNSELRKFMGCKQPWC